MSCVTIYWIATHTRLLRRCQEKIAVRRRKGHYQEIGAEREDTLPDRISNPTVYENNPGLTAKSFKTATNTEQDL